MSEADEEQPFLPDFVSETPWYHSKGLLVEKVAVSSRERLRQKHEQEESPEYLEKLKQQRDATAKKFADALGGQGAIDHRKVVVLEQQKPKKLSWKVGKRKATKSTKATCTNCGGSSHTRADCLEKPRKIAAKYRKEDDQIASTIEIRDDDALESYDAKRDNYFGYDPATWKEQAEKNKAIRERLEKEKEANKEVDSDEEDEARELEELGLEADAKTIQQYKLDTVKAPGEKVMRLIEDKAGYLSGVTAQEKAEEEEVKNPTGKSASEYKEELLFVKKTEASDYERIQKFAWDTNTKNRVGPAPMDAPKEEQEKAFQKMLAVDPDASPTAAMLALKKKSKEDQQKKSEKAKRVLEMYGD